MDDIEMVLVEIEKDIVKKFNKAQVAEILAYFSTDFVGFSSTKQDRIKNLSQLKNTFLHYLKLGEKVKFSIRSLQVRIYGEGALTTFFWKVEIQKGKKIKAVEGRGSHFFLYTENGWRIVHEHFSLAV